MLMLVLIKTDRVMSEETKAKLRLAAKKRAEQVPPWNKGLKGVSNGRTAGQKTCGVKYKAGRDTMPLPVVYRGMNTNPKG